MYNTGSSPIYVAYQWTMLSCSCVKNLPSFGKTLQNCEKINNFFS